jgi:L-arabinokinase
MTLITTDPSSNPGPPFLHLPDPRLASLNLRYPDLVAAADAVISKPGYGIVSECLANRARLLYTPRGAFREYSILVREMKRWLPAREISPERLAAGTWRDDFRRLCDQPFPPPPDTSGAEVVARRLLEAL